MSYLLNIDPGTVNFSYCLIDIIKIKIIFWENKCISKSIKETDEKVCTALYHCLNELYEKLINFLNDLNSEIKNQVIILIESQPKVNYRTIKMSGQVQMFFVHKKIDALSSNNIFKKIIGYHARNKLKYYEPEEGDPEIKKNYKSAYYKNKQIAKQHCSIVIKRLEDPESEFIKFYESSKKKDDLADSYLMGLSYIKFEINKNVNVDKEIALIES